MNEVKLTIWFSDSYITGPDFTELLQPQQETKPWLPRRHFGLKGALCLPIGRFGLKKH